MRRVGEGLENRRCVCNHTKMKIAGVEDFWASLASFGRLGRISDHPTQVFINSNNGVSYSVKHVNVYYKMD